MATEYRDQDAQGANDQDYQKQDSNQTDQNRRYAQQNEAQGQSKDWENPDSGSQAGASPGPNYSDQGPESQARNMQNDQNEWSPGREGAGLDPDDAQRPLNETASEPAYQNRASSDDELSEAMPDDYRRDDFIEENDLERQDPDYRDADIQPGEDQDDEDALRNGI